MEGNDVRMTELLQDINFAIQIVLEFLIQSAEIDGLDSYCSARGLMG
jgi:hypothetical protein